MSTRTVFLGFYIQLRVVCSMYYIQLAFQQMARQKMNVKQVSLPLNKLKVKVFPANHFAMALTKQAYNIMQRTDREIVTFFIIRKIRKN